MTNRDLDQDDARELAGFAGLEYEWTTIEKESGVLHEGGFVVRSNGYELWQPWSLEAPMWQRKVMLDAVREKGLEEEFGRELGKEVLDWCDDNNVCDVSFETHTELVSAPPEAICSAILSMEGE